MKSIEFQYQSSEYEGEIKSLDFDTDGTATVSKEDLNNYSDLMCLIQDETGKQFQLCYNEEEREIYAFQRDYDGEPFSQYGNVTVWIIFELKRTEKLQSGNTYELQLDGSHLKLSYVPTLDEIPFEELSLENALENLSGENINNLSLKNSDAVLFGTDESEDVTEYASFTTIEFDSTTDVILNTTTSSAAVTENVEEVTAEEPTETIPAVEMNAITETPTEIAAVDSISLSPMMLPIILAVVSAVGLAACGAAGYFFWKLHKEKLNAQNQQKKINELEEKQVQNQQNSADKQMLEVKLQAAYQMQQQLEQERDQMQQAQKHAVVDQDVLKKQLEESNAAVAAATLEKQNLIEQYSSAIAEKDQQIQNLQKKLYDADLRAEEYQQQTICLQNKIGKNDAEEKLYIATAETSADNPAELAKRISLSTKMADGYADAKFLNINSSLTGEVQLSESSSYRTAPLLCIKNAVMLNPYYYRDLPNNREQYDSLIHVKNVFQIDGLIGNSVMYGLDYIYPAVISTSGDGSYLIERMGKITVKVK